jgi:peroxiredoxin
MPFGLRNPQFIIVCALALLAGCSAPSASRSEPARAAAKAHADRKAAPDFTLKDANGSNVTLADYRGKVVLLNFWATWCGPCQIEIPWFQEFEQQYKSKGFEVLGVSMDEDGWAAVKPYMATHKLNYRILLGDETVSTLYGGLEALPTTFIIDREGRFAFPPHVGLVGKNEYLSEIQSLLDEKGTNASLRSAVSPFAVLLRSAK